MYEWKVMFLGYNEEEAKSFRDDIIAQGGVAIVHRNEGYEMGSGPHFQGYTVQYIEPVDLANHVDMPSQPPVDKERFKAQDEKDLCKCGHPYHRHFDSYEPGLPHVGCKYCYCGTFEEPEPWCTCGAKTMQGKHHKRGCPAREKFEQAQGHGR